METALARSLDRQLINVRHLDQHRRGGRGAVGGKRTAGNQPRRSAAVGTPPNQGAPSQIFAEKILPSLPAQEHDFSSEDLGVSRAGKRVPIPPLRRPTRMAGLGAQPAESAAGGAGLVAGVIPTRPNEICLGDRENSAQVSATNQWVWRSLRVNHRDSTRSPSLPHRSP